MVNWRVPLDGNSRNSPQSLVLWGLKQNIRKTANSLTIFTCLTITELMSTSERHWGNTFQQNYVVVEIWNLHRIIWDNLCDMLAFVQFKKRENTYGDEQLLLY